MKAIECHVSSVATPWLLLRCGDTLVERPFFTKISISYGAQENQTTLCQCSGNAAWCDRGLTYVEIKPLSQQAALAQSCLIFQSSMISQEFPDIICEKGPVTASLQRPYSDHDVATELP